MACMQSAQHNQLVNLELQSVFQLLLKLQDIAHPTPVPETNTKLKATLWSQSSSHQPRLYICT